MNSNNNKLFDACNIYVMLWALWYIQSFFTSSSLYSLLFYIPFFLMTLFYVVKVFTSYKPKGVMLALCVFFLLLAIYGIALVILNDANGQDRKSFLMMLFWSLGPIFAFYVFTKQGMLTEERIKRFLIVFLIIVPLVYYQSSQQAMKIVLEAGSDFEETTNNAAYFVAGLFPFVFLLYKKPVFQYIFLALVFFLVVTGMKRGAMLVTAMMMVWYVYVSLKTTKRRKWAIVLFTIVFLAIGYRFIIQYFEQSAYFQNRYEQTISGDSSNRDVLYQVFWYHWLENDNVIQVMFGEGAYHTENILSKAHNDWLELLIDCGLFSVILYLVYWLSFVRDWRKSKPDFLIYSMMGCCLVFTFIRSLFSMSFGDMPLYTSMIMGYCFAWSNSGTIRKTITNE